MKIINPPLKKYALLVLNERTQRECHTPHGDTVHGVCDCHLGKSTENVNIFENRTLTPIFFACSPLTSRSTAP